MFGLRSWKIGKIMGIPIGIDISWLIIFGLLTYELATGFFPFELGFRRPVLNVEIVALSVIASLLLFASVLAHELSHAWMALRRGVPVLGITLFIFGGVAQIGDEPDRPATEFLIAIMGPLMSLVLAILFAIFWIWPRALIGFLPDARFFLLPLSVTAAYLTQTNLLLVAFNLLPGFPLDGGRVLRAGLWGALHDQRRATYLAMLVGRGIAGLIVAAGVILTFGVFNFPRRADLSGLWPILVGIFLWNAAGEAYRSVLLRDELKAAPVAQLMHTPVPVVEAQLGLGNFIDEFLLRQRAGVFAVQEAGQAVGVIGPVQVRNVPRARWDSMQVRDAMLALRQSDVVTPEDTALRVMQKLTRRDGEELPVVKDGAIVGIIGHEEIARYLKWKSRG